MTTRSGVVVSPPKMAIMPNAGDALVYVNEDGSVRELTEAERTYVETEFCPLDGAQPYIKSRYLEPTAWGLQGYLPRTAVPEEVAIQPVPPHTMSQPQTPQTVADSLAERLRRRERS